MAEGHPVVIHCSKSYYWSKGASPLSHTQRTLASPLFLHPASLASLEIQAISFLSLQPQTILIQYALVPEEQEQGNL